MFVSNLQTGHTNKTTEIQILLPGPLADMELKDQSLSGLWAPSVLSLLLAKFSGSSAEDSSPLHAEVHWRESQSDNKSDSLPWGFFVPTDLNSPVPRMSFFICSVQAMQSNSLNSAFDS